MGRKTPDDKGVKRLQGEQNGLTWVTEDHRMWVNMNGKTNY